MPKSLGTVELDPMPRWIMHYCSFFLISASTITSSLRNTVTFGENGGISIEVNSICQIPFGYIGSAIARENLVI